VDAERRQIVVLFTDMVEFTPFSERAGEEAAFTLMRSLSKLMDEAVRREGGLVRGFTGDGIMAVFGAPVALEDAPLRACRAALSILERLQAAGPDLEANYGVKPQLRIGLNAGVAVLGQVQEGADAGVTVLGDTVNFAARLQGLAAPNSVYMSEATHRLLLGLVDASLVGEHTVKGKSVPQQIYRLNSVHIGATRFGAAVTRGLGSFFGRERDMEVLESGLNNARSGCSVIDIVAEPGMGKSRLVYEFLHRHREDHTFVLSGTCSPDGQQTPFLPVIEAMRGAFRIGVSDAETNVAEKLEIGLSKLALNSPRNLGLLLHLLGLRVPNDALAGLDGLLIGLRTRELLQQLLEARCRLSPVVMMIEDLHWIDSASEELLGKIVENKSLRLLLLTTRRPEYAPPWLNTATLPSLLLEPLCVADVRHLVKARLGVGKLPDALARQVTEKAEGNPLFAEEIVSFLTERGSFRSVGGDLSFEVNADAAAIPASIQSLLTARVDRLAPKDRALLQVASVIGRKFDPRLLADVIGETDIGERLAVVQASNLVFQESDAGDYTFKHALVRDALYQSLLSEQRNSLHLKIAEQLERRSANRLTEVAEALAHHYGQTDQTDKAFVYLCAAGSKSIRVYSLDEAATHFAAALALVDSSPDCASDDSVAEFLVSYSLMLNLSLQVKVTIDVLGRYVSRINRLGDDPRAVLIRHHYVFALLWNARYREAATMQRETTPIAHRLGDNRSKAYALAGEIHVSSVIAPKSFEEFEQLKREAIKVASETEDAYIQNWTRFVIGWEEFHRGRITDARDSARKLMQVGRLLGDPRSTGLGLALSTWIALVSDSPAEAFDLGKESLAVAITPFDRSAAYEGQGCALVLLRRTDEGAKLLEEHRRRCVENGYLYSLNGHDGIVGVCKIFQGKIADGVRWIEDAIVRRETDGYLTAVEWYRLSLAEVYLQVIAGSETLPFPALMKNLPILTKIIVTGPGRIRALIALILKNPHLHPEGFHTGRAQMILGLLYKAKKKPLLALQYLTEAKRILSQFGETPILARIETALAELGAGGHLTLV
jgi:class 3 adenylate cyclase